MRKIQLYMDEELDDRLAERAKKSGVSKASLIRLAAAKEFPAEKEIPDPWIALVGDLDDDPIDNIDDVIYR